MASWLIKILQMKISVVIPTLNEAENIVALLDYLRQTSPAACEYFVVDGGSTDNTATLAQQAGAKVLCSHQRSRAIQMNLGAANASGEVLYFVHADVRPPNSWASDIAHSLANGYVAGCFSYRFNSDNFWLRINGRLTRRHSILTGGGDQTLFVRKDIFEKMGGFQERLCIMEDFDFVWRLKKKYPFQLIRHDALVSARKYHNNHYLYVQLVNALTVVLFKIGYPPEKLRTLYRRLLGVR